MLRVARGQQIFAAVYWLPLLGYDTCARLSELVYLELGDIDVGQATLKIRPTRRRRLKNAVSRRTLPLHPELIRLGFLDYVNYKRMLKPEDLCTTIAAIPEVTWDLRAYDWTLIGSSLTLSALETQTSTRLWGSRRRSLPSSPPHSVWKDNAKGPGRPSPRTEACPRRNPKPIRVPC